MAASGDHRVLLPTEDSAPSARPLRIGFFGNIANNAYNFVKCLRRLNFDAELVIEDGCFDAFLLNRPFWEEISVECNSYEEGLSHERRWSPPAFVRRVSYDVGLQQRYQDNPQAIPEVQKLYKDAFGIELPIDRALLLAQNMGHWPYLLAMKRYDVIQFSGAPLCMGPFCPRPFVAFPTGSDLFIAPFEETTFGLQIRCGYRAASHLLVCETNYPAYLHRLAPPAPQTFVPLMIDTETYALGSGGDLRVRWARAVGGSRFLLGVCRQSWQWKGNDRLIQAFAAFTAGGRNEEWRLILQEWGPDIARTRELIASLGVQSKVLWQPLCSKPLLRCRQQAADAVADQFVMAGYGTSVLESMAAGKPVLMAPPEEGSDRYLASAPPFVGGRTVAEIVNGLEQIAQDEFRCNRGEASRKWLEDCHGYRALAEKYMRVYSQTAGRQIESDSAAHSPSIDLFQSLQQLHAYLRKQMKEKYQRSVPLADELTDRWERAHFLDFGMGTSIYDSALVLGSVEVGNHTWIGPHCILDGSGGLEIGDHCSVAAGCQIYSHDTVDWALSGGESPYQRRKTRIGSSCYLGPGSIITAGTAIGDHCLIGALSLVKGDIPAGSIVAGSPARIIGRVLPKPDGTVQRIYDHGEGPGAAVLNKSA